MARRLKISQAAVSRLERSKPTVASLQRYIEALDGELTLNAVFADGTFVVDVNRGPKGGSALPTS